MTEPRGNDELFVIYRNYRGETRRRRIRPVRWWFGKTALHPKPGWVCTAVDLERQEAGKQVVRDFSVPDFLAIGPDNVEAYEATQAALVAAAGG